MMRTRPLVALFLAGAVPLAVWLLGGARESRPSEIDAVLDAPSLPASVLRVMSLGFHNVSADTQYLSAVQVFGDRGQTIGASPEQRVRRAKAIARLLDYATDFDKDFNYAYVFGANAIPTTLADGSPVGVEEAVALLKKGVAKAGENCHGEQPGKPMVNCDWRIPFNLAYLQTSELGDFRGAAQAMAEAAKRPRHPVYLELLATRLAAVGGAIDTGLAMCQAMLVNADTEERKAELAERCTLLEMERDLLAIEDAVTAYVERSGHLPSSLEDVQAAGLLGRIPPEPHGGKYELDPETGTVRSTAAERLRLPDRVEREIDDTRRRVKAQQKEEPHP